MNSNAKRKDRPVSEFEIRSATRQGVKPLIGLYSESGCGKTLSALLLARGFVGPSGKIAMVDTESGRGSLYADVVPGGYDVLELRQPFSPARYMDALTAIEKSGATIGVIDSVSHQWEGVGGVLDMASENEARSGKAGLHNWKQPKMEHAKFMLRLLQSPLPLIVCIRAKHKTRQTKENGRTVIVKDDHTTPIQAEDFIFELTAHAEIQPDHSIVLTKCSHPALRDCFPTSGPITVEHGRLLAQWCAAPSKPSGGVNTAADAKRWLWEKTKEHHGGSKDKLEKWLLDQSLIGDSETLAGLSVDRLSGILAEIEKRESDLIP